MQARAAGTRALRCHSRSCVHSHRRLCKAHAMPEWMRSMLDFQSWAPKSSRIWRLQQYEGRPSTEPDEVDELEAQINRLAASGNASSSVISSRQPSELSNASSSEDVALPATGSFSDADDSELSRALSARLQMLSGDGQWAEATQSSSEDEAPPAQGSQVLPLSGAEIRQLLLVKYEKAYDMSFVRRDIPGKTFVALNIMWQHLEQRSFRMTEEQYMEKMDSVAYLVNVLDQTQLVRAFLQKPAKSEKGLPKRPVVGTAISIRLDLPPQVISEFFGSGYQ
ncbi:hypothetical protein V8C86DRAFT_1820329 [Haematococcus lacustris]